MTKSASKVSDTRKVFAEGFISLGNIAAGALLFGQAFGGFDFDMQLAGLGLFLAAALYATAFSVMKGGGN